MKVLVLGSGGREHALVWKLKQSPRISQVICAPGNGGICADAACVAGDMKDVSALANLAVTLAADLTVVGPEVPLALGVVDEFQRRGLRIFGPTKKAAQLEGSKAFAKEFMQRHNIPTARYAICTTAEEVNKALAHFSAPVVVKASGLAAGKGVVIAETKEEAAAVAADMLSGNMLGEAGAEVVLEEFLEGEEVSFLVLSDGERVAPLVACQDHKRVGEGDTGPNTGGMGAYSTDKLLAPEMRDWCIKNIARPVVAGMKAEGAEYKGILYIGLMMTAKGPMVLEFNCRFGDPETQAILMRMDSDLLSAIEDSIDGKVSENEFTWSADPSATVILASGGYPGSYENGKLITGLDAHGNVAVDGVKVFHAGTKWMDGKFYTNGGRVLAVTARGINLKQALDSIYEACKRIDFEGMHYRTDIGWRAMKR